MDKLDELIMKAAETYVDPDVELFEVMEQDATGAILTPGFPERCQGNGEHPNFEICCDNCDHFLTCICFSCNIYRRVSEILYTFFKKNFKTRSHPE